MFVYGDGLSAACCGSGFGLSSFLTSSMESSSPCSLAVWPYPRSCWQMGQFLLRPSVPINHLSTQVWHPIMFVQHRAKMMGGTQGVMWHILHRNASSVTALNAIGMAPQLAQKANCMSSMLFFMLLSSFTTRCWSEEDCVMTVDSWKFRHGVWDKRSFTF